MYEIDYTYRTEKNYMINKKKSIEILPKGSKISIMKKNNDIDKNIYTEKKLETSQKKGRQNG